MSTVTVGVEFEFDLDDKHAVLVKDMLAERIDKSLSAPTMLTDNIGIYDYNPAEKITSVSVD